jgi:hypothetical protein
MGCAFDSGYHGLLVWWRIPRVACSMADTTSYVFGDEYYELHFRWRVP